MRLLLGLPTVAASFDHLVALVRRAEDAGVHAVTIGDPRWPDEPGKRAAAIAFEPLTLASALAASTSRIGIIVTAGIEPTPPYNLARRFASLDVISKGRGGWLLPAGTAADRRAAEYLEVVTGLWRSWDAHALVRDKERGLFFDPQRMRTLAHRGAHFAVRGPLNVGRSPQGAPVIAIKVHSGDDAILAARCADLVLVDAETSSPAIDRLSVASRIVSTTTRDSGRLEPLLRSGAYGGLHLRLEDEGEAEALLDRALAELRRCGLLGDAPAGATLRARLAIREPA